MVSELIGKYPTHGGMMRWSLLPRLPLSNSEMDRDNRSSTSRSCVRGTRRCCRTPVPLDESARFTAEQTQ